jgi:hypothetical protein
MEIFVFLAKRSENVYEVYRAAPGLGSRLHARLHEVYMWLTRRTKKCTGMWKRVLWSVVDKR